jgi:hypothetical protein
MKHTRKVLAAVNILAEERFFDAEPGELLADLEEHGITAEQVYRALEWFGYRWITRHWCRPWPRWMRTVKRKRDRRALGGLDEGTALVVRAAARVSRGC